MKKIKMTTRSLVEYIRLMKPNGSALSDTWHTERTCPVLCKSSLKIQTKVSDVKPHGEICDACLNIAKKRRAAK